MWFYFTQKYNLINLTGPKRGKNFSHVASATERFSYAVLLFDYRADFVAHLYALECVVRNSDEWYQSLGALGQPSSCTAPCCTLKYHYCVQDFIRPQTGSPCPSSHAVENEAIWAPLSHVCSFSFSCWVKSMWCSHWHPALVMPMGDVHKQQPKELFIFPLPLYFCSSFYPQVSTSGKGQGFKWKLQICLTLHWNAPGSWSGCSTPGKQFNLQSSFAREKNIWMHWLVWDLLRSCERSMLPAEMCVRVFRGCWCERLGLCQGICFCVTTWSFFIYQCISTSLSLTQKRGSSAPSASLLMIPS